MPKSSPCAIVIFGASGHLAKRKLIPALYELARQKLLSEQSAIVGYSRTDMSDEQFRKNCREALDKFARTKPIDEAIWKKLEPSIQYCRGEYGCRGDYDKLAGVL